jgi:hypothetical protein
VRSIPVWYRGKVADYALIDEEDFEMVSKHKWYLHPQQEGNGKGHQRFDAEARIRGTDGRKRTVRMHRLIMGLPPRHVFIDHINRRTLDNRRANLRPATPKENAQNQRARLVSRHGARTSSHRGVCFDKSKQRWKAQVVVNGRRVFSKLFKTEKEAAAAASAGRRRFMPFSAADQTARSAA